MRIGRTKIECEGFRLGHDCEQKLERIVSSLESLFEPEYLRMNFVRFGRIYEVFVSGRVDNLRVGFYLKNKSLPQLLDQVFKRAKSECSKVKKFYMTKKQTTVNSSNAKNIDLAG